MHRTTRIRSLALTLTTLGLLACVPEKTRDGTTLEGLPTTLSQSVSEGGPNPAALTFSIGNPGTCPLAYTLTPLTADGRAWLSAAPASGTVAPNGQAQITLSLDVVTPALPPGTYTGTVVASGTCTTNGQPAARSPRNISMNLTVVPTGAILDLSTTTFGQDIVTLADRWTPLANYGMPDPGSHPESVFTGYDLLVPVIAGSALTLGRYSVAADAWSTSTTTLLTSAGPRVAWTGSKMYLWGGTSPDVVHYAPATDTWTRTAVTSPPSARAGHSLVWTGTELLAWGGHSATSANVVYADGKRYNPATSPTGPWAALAAVPSAFEARSGHTTIWTGADMLVYGGTTDPSVLTGPNFRANGARYTRATDRWTTLPTLNAPAGAYGHTAIWTGSRMLVWGGSTTDAAFTVTASGAIYFPGTHEWRPMAASPLSPRMYHSAVWTGSVMVVWGGYDGVNQLSDGAYYDPATNTWTALTNTNAPPFRYQHGAAWTGSGMLIFGGRQSASSQSLYLYR